MFAIQRGDFNPFRIQEELDRFPALWNQHPLRTQFPGTPFKGTSDIWLRYGTDPATMGGPHFAEFYPAWETLTHIHALVWGQVSAFCPVALGGILLSRIPPGGEVKKHCDAGHWHSEFYNFKLYSIIQANPECINWFGPSLEEAYIMSPGTVWEFNNLVPHSVVNNGDCDRVALITCMRTER